MPTAKFRTWSQKKVPADGVPTIICGFVRKVFEHLVFYTVVADIIKKRIGSGCVAASGANKNKMFEEVRLSKVWDSATWSESCTKKRHCCEKVAKGNENATKRKPKSAKRSQKGATREPKGAKREPKIKKIIKNHTLERSKFSFYLALVFFITIVKTVMAHL